MKYDLNIELDLIKFKERVNFLIDKKSKIEIRKITKQRTIKQNSYLHVVITLFAIYFGYTIAEAKTLLKRKCNFMTYEKKGVKFLQSTANLNSKEMTIFIDYIRNLASKEGCYIPTSNEYLINKYSIDKEIENNNQYL